MSYELTIKKKEEILWVKATGTRSLETVLAMSNDILTACVEHNTKKILVDVRQLEGRLRSIDSYELFSRHAPKIRDLNIITRNAIVDLEEFGSSYNFLETVAVNRGFNSRVFTDLDEAVKWLEN